MYIPKLQAVPFTRQTLDVFGGYSRNLPLADGEFFDMENMSSDHFPALASRKPRGLVHLSGTIGRVTDIAPAEDSYCYISPSALEGFDTLFLPSGHRLVLDTWNVEHSMVTMGAYLIILPDKVWVNLAKLGELDPSAPDVPEDAHGSIEALFENTAADYWVWACSPTGERYDPKTTGPTAPADPGDGEIWMDTSGETGVLRRWSEITGAWSVLEANHVVLQTAGVGAAFREGDGIAVTLETAAGNQDIADTLGEFTQQQRDGKTVGVLRGQWTVVCRSYDTLVVRGQLRNAAHFGAKGMKVAVERTMPDMDYIFECGNRLWGCKYGSTEKGFVNELYASKLGDFQNWNCFQGISTDSFVASVGAPGPFTGAVAYQGRPIFFKEDGMIEVYGSYPAQYQVQTTPCYGVQQGCHRSIALVDNTLYYKSRDGVCAFDGSLPVQIGRALGEVRYEQAAAGGCGGKYYVSMRRSDAPQGVGWNLFVYDARRKLWHREDDLAAKRFCANRGVLYCLRANGKEIYDMNRQTGTLEKEVCWMAQTGPIGLSLPDAKYVTELSLCLCLAEGGQVSIYACYDPAGPWEHLHTLSATTLGRVNVPIRPKRCDHIQLRICGRGEGKLYSLTKTTSGGRYVL